MGVMDVLTYYTVRDDEAGGYYKERSSVWLERMRELGYPNARAIPLPCSGSWGLNTRRKAPLIAAARRGLPLLWLDVDDEYHAIPEIPEGVDVAGCPSGMQDRWVASGVLYFAASPEADAVVREWVSVTLDKRYARKSDEWALNLALKRCESARVGYVSSNLRTFRDDVRRGRFWPGATEEIDCGAAIED